MTACALTGATFAVAAAGAGAPSGAQAAGLAVDCDRVASPGVRIHRFVHHLKRGQTACLRSGTYTFGNRLKVARPAVTLTSYPGERAELVGRLWVARRATGAKVLDLDLNGRNRDNLPSPVVTATDTVWRGLDVTNGHDRTICFHLGSGTYGTARRTLIEGNRIHDCGQLPASNHHHGIYVLHAHDSVIRDNLIYSNADRGINLYPNAKRVRIVANVIDGNGEGVMFAGSPYHTSSGNLVAQNIISNSQIRWNVESWWPDRVGQANVVQDNCVFPSNPRSDAYNQNGGIGNEIGFDAFDNTVTNPAYVNRAAEDFRLQPWSACQGYGPGTGG